VLVGPYPRGGAADLNGDGVAIDHDHYHHEESLSSMAGRRRFHPRPALRSRCISFRAGVADINGDGRPDLLTRTCSTAMWHLHHGQATAASKSKTNPSGDGPVALAIGEVDGDGELDIVTATSPRATCRCCSAKARASSATSSVWRLNAPQAAQALGVNPAPSAIAIADVNGDSFADIVTADYGRNSVSLLLGAARGAFSPRTRSRLDSNPSRSRSPMSPAMARSTCSPQRRSADVSLLVNQGAGRFAASEQLAAGAAPASLVVTDLNGDRTPTWSPAALRAPQRRSSSVRRGRVCERILCVGGDECSVRSTPAVVLGASAFDGCTTLRFHLLNVAQEDNDIAITFVDEFTGLGVAQYTGTCAQRTRWRCRQSRADRGLRRYTLRPVSKVLWWSRRSVRSSAFAELLTLNGSRDAYDGSQRWDGSSRIVLPILPRTSSDSTHHHRTKHRTGTGCAHVQYTPRVAAYPEARHRSRSSQVNRIHFAWRRSHRRRERAILWIGNRARGQCQRPLCAVGIHEDSRRVRART